MTDIDNFLKFQYYIYAGLIFLGLIASLVDNDLDIWMVLAFVETGVAGYLIYKYL